MGPLLSMVLIAAGFLVMIRFRSDFHRMGLQVLGAAIAFVGALILPFVTSPLAVLFPLMVGVLLMVVTAQYVLARRLRRARLASPPAAPKPPRVADPSAPPAPPFAPLVIDLVDRPASQPQPQHVADVASELRRAWSMRNDRRLSRPGSGTPVLFLWVFAAQMSQLVLVIRNRFGPVEVLNGGGALIDDLVSMRSVLFGHADAHIEETEAEVLTRIARFKRRKIWAWWSINSMLCTDAVWRFALDQLIERNELVVMDLTMLSGSHEGSEYEIGVLLDRLPAHRCVFVVGAVTDETQVLGKLKNAWDTMAIDSPNRDPSSAPLRIVRFAHLDLPSNSKKRPPPQHDAEIDSFVELLRVARARPLPPPIRGTQA